MGGNNQTVAKANKQGDFQVAHTQTDALILPTGDIERLQVIRPDLVDLIKAETSIEAAHRRTMESSFNSNVQTERLTLIVGSMILGLGSLVLAYVIAIYANAYAGAGLGLGAIVTLAVAMLRALNARR